MKRNAKTWTKGGWKIETALTNTGTLRQNITSPSGFEAFADYIGFDGRLSGYRTSANIEYGSGHLKLSEAMIDKMIFAAKDWFIGLELSPGEELMVSTDEV
jgi:hypothetical protein